jgi:hypothetical protein
MTRLALMLGAGGLLVLPAPATHAAGPALPDAARIDAWRQTVLARPLFSPSRHPDATPDLSAPRPRLAGIVVSGGRRRAIFMLREDGPGQVVDVGQAVGPWRVIAIGDTSVRVRGDDGEQTLRPDRDRGTDDRPDGPSSTGPTGTPSGLSETEERIPGNMQ